jgi:hypothetical protein
MGLRHATGRPYESFVFLLEELSRPAQAGAGVLRHASARSEGEREVVADLVADRQSL